MLGVSLVVAMVGDGNLGNETPSGNSGGVFVLPMVDEDLRKYTSNEIA